MKIVYLFIVVFLAMTCQTVVAWNNKNFKIRSCSSHSDCETIAKSKGDKAIYLVSYCVVDAQKNGRCLFLFPKFSGYESRPNGFYVLDM